MPLYDYKALSSDGKTSKGIVEADSQKNARLKLKKQGLMVTEIKEKDSVKKPGRSGATLFGGGFNQNDVATMTRQLASLVKANIPLVDAISALVEQLDNVALRNILSQAAEFFLEEGEFVSQTAFPIYEVVVD